jgi:hypothetical protein
MSGGQSSTASSRSGIRLRYKTVRRICCGYIKGLLSGCITLTKDVVNAVAPHRGCDMVHAAG